jgi:hypothetical protein
VGARRRQVRLVWPGRYRVQVTADCYRGCQHSRYYRYSPIIWIHGLDALTRASLFAAEFRDDYRPKGTSQRWACGHYAGLAGDKVRVRIRSVTAEPRRHPMRSGFKCQILKYEERGDRSAGPLSLLTQPADKTRLR